MRVEVSTFDPFKIQKQKKIIKEQSQVINLIKSSYFIRYIIGNNSPNNNQLVRFILVKARYIPSNNLH